MENKGKLFEFSKNMWKQLQIVTNLEKIYEKFVENNRKLYYSVNT